MAQDVDYCIALRAYALCTRRQARSCRGDLVYHSAVFRIKELFSQHNCSSDGPTSSAKVPSTSRPAVPELCNYESRVLVMGSGSQQKKYAHCGLFGDPHLRTFRDEFQTCKVEGAWPLIDNRYLSVQVTNVPVVLGSSATATSKVWMVLELVEIDSQQILSVFADVLQCVTCQVFPKLTHGKVNFPLTLGLICDCMWTFFLRLMPDVSRAEYSGTTGRYSRLPFGVDLLALVFP